MRLCLTVTKIKQSASKLSFDANKKGPATVSQGLTAMCCGIAARWRVNIKRPAIIAGLVLEDWSATVPVALFGSRFALVASGTPALQSGY